MKRFIHYILFIYVGLLLSACENHESASLLTPSLKECFLKVSPTTLTCPGNESTLELNVESQNVHWRFTHVPGWITVIPESGYSSAKVTIKVSANSTTGKKTAVINLSSDETDNVRFVQSIEIKQEVGTSSGTFENGHEYVDLGLTSGLLWATCNVGASSPSDYGNYYAWGETTTKSTYTESNYVYSDNPTTLPLDKDAARANWGGSWRMPTKAEQDELRSNCTWTWTTMNGVNGYKVTSKTNGKSIFLPAAGSRYYSGLNDDGSSGYYWSSSLYTSYSGTACCLYFNSGKVDWHYDGLRYGQSVRAVCQ